MSMSKEVMRLQYWLYVVRPRILARREERFKQFMLERKHLWSAYLFS